MLIFKVNFIFSYFNLIWWILWSNWREFCIRYELLTLIKQNHYFWIDDWNWLHTCGYKLVFCDDLFQQSFILLIYQLFIDFFFNKAGSSIFLIILWKWVFHVTALDRLRNKVAISKKAISSIICIFDKAVFFKTLGYFIPELVKFICLLH